MMDHFFAGLFNWLLHATLGFIPAWAWIIVAGLLLGWAWKTFGWQGLLGAGLAILTIGAYRQGWRTRDAEDRPETDLDPADRAPAHRRVKPKPGAEWKPTTITERLTGRPD